MNKHRFHLNTVKPFSIQIAAYRTYFIHVYESINSWNWGTSLEIGKVVELEKVMQFIEMIPQIIVYSLKNGSFSRCAARRHLLRKSIFWREKFRQNLFAP